MNPQKNLQISVLLDYYSKMLTEKQQEAVNLYYNEDLSLAEIAEHTKITRQGVRDSIKRGEQTLLEMEEKFHLAEKSKKYYEIIDEVGVLCADIMRECANLGYPRAIYRRAEYLVKLADENKELF
ncbi:MAG: putative DNA-binding protein [Oscillospiraceae bacterium]|nr:putative DNA-binding protein [Oscillospiraceae bacterium]